MNARSATRRGRGFSYIITINEIITLKSVVLLSKDRLYTIRSTTKKKSHRSTNILS